MIKYLMIIKKTGRAQAIICCLVFSLLANGLRAQADSGYFKSFDGTKIYYESAGKGEPVILIHGFIVNSQSWKKTAVYTGLVSAGYQVIVLD